MSGDRLAGQVAIVTGASRGLGKSIAEAFAREGASVAVVARTETQWDERLPGTIHETVAGIEAQGGRAVAIAADLANPDDVERVVPEARAALGPIGVLVNNAALTVPGRPGGSSRRQAPPAEKRPSRPFGSFLDFPLKGFRLHFEVGLFAAYRLMQLALPDMVEAGRGSIVTISSVAGFLPGEGPYALAGVPGPIAYGGNKAALHHLTQCVAVEAQAHGIAVNILSPSEPVLSPGNRYALPNETDFAPPEEFAEATVRVALADPATTNGQLLWSGDVLHPELGRRGWVR